MSEQEATNPVEGVAEAPEAPAQEQTSQTETETTDLAEGEHSDAPVEEADDVEYEGKQYRVPKEIKDALLRQADYTRKTQEVADQRREFEETRQAFAEQTRIAQEHIKDVAKLVSLDEQIERYQKVDWNTYYAQDRDSADAHWRQFTLLKESRQQVAGQVAQKEQQRASEGQRETAKQLEQAEAVLKREIPEWSPTLRDKLKDFAVAKGIPARDVTQIRSPAVVKILHLAYLGEQSLTKARAAAKPTAPVAQPVPTVTARQSPRVDLAPSDKDDMETWLRKREAQQAKKGR